MNDREKIKQLLGNLRAITKDHNEVGMNIAKAFDGKLYPMDLFSFAVLNRSISLLDAFCDLIEKRNFVVAAALLRLQLDNLMRYRAAWLVENPHDFVTTVLGGEKIRNIKDREGFKMTDTYLNESLSKDFPKLKDIYQHTSGYIHLSEKHFFNAMRPDKNYKVSMKVGPTDSFIPEKSYLDAIAAFMEITSVLFLHLQGWKVAKEKNKK